MKRPGQIITFMASAMILLMTAGCATIEKEPLPGKEIAVRPVHSIQTKVPGTVGFTQSTFGVFANKTSDAAGTDSPDAWLNSDFWTSNGNLSNMYINDGCFALGGDVYIGVNPQNIIEHHPYRWPIDGSLMFMAYAPHQSNSFVNEQKKQETNIKSVSVKNYQETGKMGYMMIKVTLNPEAEKDFDLLYVDTKQINLNKTSGMQLEPVPLVFKHAQSKVTFRISNPEGQYKVTARLLDCINSATFYSGNTPGWLPDFKDTDNVLRDYTLFTEQALSGTPSEISLHLIPMQLSGIYDGVAPNTNKIVTLELALAEQNGIGKQTVQYKMTDFTETWKPGMHYIYNININSHRIEFDKPEIVDIDLEVDL